MLGGVGEGGCLLEFYAFGQLVADFEGCHFGDELDWDGCVGIEVR